MATYNPIQSVTLTADANTVSFIGISQDYTHLEIVITARSSHSDNSNFYYRVNGDATSSYTVIRLQGNGSTVVSNKGTANTVGYIGYVDASNSGSGIFGATKIYLNNYSSSSTYKTLLSKGATPGTNGYAAYFVNGYAGSTAPITSISFTPDAGNWVAGSTFSMYGIDAGQPKANGGTTVVNTGTHWIHTFTSTDVFELQVPSLTVDYLVVAGGGGGGFNGGGGGGAGGYRSGSSLLLNTRSKYTVLVGAGGASPYAGEKGSNSSIHTISATGGGIGRQGGDAQGGSGGSGGGGAYSGYTPGTGGIGNEGGYSPVEGYNGGGGQTNGWGGGGGGSASAGSTGGSPGSGTSNSISGSAVTYAQGGNGGFGGSGGPVGGTGTANRGNGGGGGYNAANGGPGGSGIVIVKYPV